MTTMRMMMNNSNIYIDDGEDFDVNDPNLFK